MDPSSIEIFYQNLLIFITLPDIMTVQPGGRSAEPDTVPVHIFFTLVRLVL
jgi:hypothetical protein